MFRFLIRSGVVALFVLSLAAPAQALPSRESGIFGFSLSELWEHLTAPFAGFAVDYTRGTCDPNGGDCAP